MTGPVRTVQMAAESGGLVRVLVPSLRSIVLCGYDPERTLVSVANNGTQTVFVGLNPMQDPSEGFPVYPGQRHDFPTNRALHAITTAGSGDQDVRVWMFAQLQSAEVDERQKPMMVQDVRGEPMDDDLFPYEGTITGDPQTDVTRDQGLTRDDRTGVRPAPADPAGDNPAFR